MASIEVAKRGQSSEIISRFLKNKTAVLGLGIALILVFAALFPLPAALQPHQARLLETFLPPGGAHPFGTDEFGRDIFARIVYGTQTLLKIGIASVSLACIIGVILGSISGYYGGVTDNNPDARHRRHHGHHKHHVGHLHHGSSRPKC